MPVLVLHLIPLELWPTNVGSNEGLNEALWKVHKFYKKHSHSPHSCGEADINIFYHYYLVSSLALC